MCKNRISKRLKYVLTINLIIFFQLFVNAQTKRDANYLLKIGIEDHIYSKILNESRTIYIQLPADYNKNKKYPVVYILDGEMLLPTVNGVQTYYSGGYTPEMILVGISNANNRTRDLTTSKVTKMYGMPFNHKNGEAAKFSNFIEKELIPFIENKYPVTNYRTLIGHSYGGLFTIYTLLHKPELFMNYIAIDPSLDWNNQKLLKEAKGMLGSKKYKNKSLFMSLGGQLHMQDSKITIDNVMSDKSDFTLFARSNITFSNLVKKNKENGLTIKWKFYKNDIHGTIPFPSIMDGLISLFKWYQMENTDKINSFDTSKDNLLKIIKYREEKLKNNFGYLNPPYPEELLIMSGFMNMEMKQTEKAKMYFKLAIEYYPKSENVYSSMADFYEANKDFTNAIKNVNKAFLLSNNNSYKERINQLKKKQK